MSNNSSKTLLYASAGCAAAVAVAYALRQAQKSAETPVAENPVASKEDIQEQKQPQVEQEAASAAPDTKPRLAILFGSQTGTAEQYSRILAKEGLRFGFATEVLDLEGFDVEQLKEETLVILVTSSYGEGEPPDNALAFFTAVMDSDLPADSLAKTHYTVFGLGNRQYQHYQACGRKLDRRFEELGAKRVFARGEADADSTGEEDFEVWRTQLWPELSKMFGTHESEEQQITKQMQVKYLDGIKAIPPAFPQPILGLHTISSKCPFNATITENRELLGSASDTRSTRHVVFDITGSGLEYHAGDHVGIYPANDPRLVTAFAQRLGIEDQLDRVISFTPISDQDAFMPPKFPQRTSIRNILTWYLDLVGRPKQSTLAVYALYASDAAEKEKIELMASNTEEGKKLYHSFIKSAFRHPLEVLNAFPSVAIPLDHFLEVTPRSQPRFYSIASSSKVSPNHITVVTGLLAYTKHHKTHEEHDAVGVCSSYLGRSEVGSKAPIFIRKSTFKLPSNPETPIIMVGPGTGLAPFMGFLQELTHAASQPASSGGPSDRPSRTEATLYFGCRTSAGDFLYETELKKLHSDGIIELRTAFSRDEHQKSYVQHLLIQDGAAVWKKLQEQKGHFYICGDAKRMAKDVDAALIEIVSKHGNMSVEDAKEFMSTLQSEGRYFADVWSPPM